VEAVLENMKMGIYEKKGEGFLVALKDERLIGWTCQTSLL
jgi:hypothetical protein